MDSLNRLHKPIGTEFFGFNTVLSCDILLKTAGKIENGYEAVK